MRKRRYFIEYAFMAGLFKLLSRLPLRVASSLGTILGGIIAVMPLKTCRTARQNLRKVFPDLSETDIRNLQFASTQHLARTFCEAPRIYAMSTKRLGQLVEVEGEEYLHQTPDALILSAHLGNWEVLNRILKLHSAKVATIYRRANNPYVSKLIDRLRASTSDMLIPKGANGSRKLLKAVKGGYCIAFLNDQKMNDGIDTTFFNLPVKSASALAGLARKHDKTVIPAFCLRQKRGYKMIFHPPVTLQKTSDAQADTIANTQLFNDIIEKQVRAYPAQWLWGHKRFS